MIDFENLRTASLYINNQLLSRGLLRDGRSIDFDHPAGGDDHDLPDTMGRIMGVVNDLILRRDVVHISIAPFSDNNPLTTTQSATPNTANPSPPPCAPYAPTPSARPTPSSAYKTSSPKPTEKSPWPRPKRTPCAPSSRPPRPPSTNSRTMPPAQRSSSPRPVPPAQTRSANGTARWTP